MNPAMQTRLLSRPNRILLLSLAVLWQSNAIAEDTSRITRVTLYPGSAAIERSVHVPAGATQVELSGLPTGFDTRNIRAEADDGIRLGPVTVQDVSSAQANSPREAELRVRIQKIDDQLALLDVESQSAEMVASYLKNLNGESADRKSAIAIDPRTLPATLDAIRQGGSDALGRIQKLAVQKRELGAQREVLQRDLDRLASSTKDSRTLTIALAAARAGELRISYQINGPGWQPVYRATLDSAGEKIEIERQAIIMQNSGEDWSGIALRLSSSQPRNAPESRPPASWRLSLIEPRPARSGFAAPSAPAPASPAPMTLSLQKVSVPTEPETFNVAVFNGAFATEFEVPGKVTLPSDGRKLTVSLNKQTLPTVLQVRVIPRQDSNAWLTAEVAHPDGVWLPGEMQLYRDGSYVGITHLGTMSDDKWVLPFGQDKLVSVSVAHAKQMSGSSGFIDRKNERQIADTYNIVNRHQQAVKLLLLEPTPVSTAEQISVETRFEPAPTRQNWNDIAGVSAWERPLNPGETAKFSVDYRIAWPKDLIINGLP